MAKCPYCGNEASKPVRVLKNSFIDIEAYECKECYSKFKVFNNPTLLSINH
jgi:transposase-like protein